jgi:NADH dehydrogenase (ubiquinone) Fe-S protein 5
MSSGWGLHGGTSRCFPFYQDFVKCMVSVSCCARAPLSPVLQRDGEDPVKECTILRDDYLECLHHRKEVSCVDVRAMLVGIHSLCSLQCDRKLTIKREAEKQAALASGGGGHGHH